MSDPLLAQVNRMGDPPTPLAQKHCAALCTLDEPKPNEPFELTFRVGSVPHPMEPDHSIQFVELFAEALHLARVDFVPGLSVAEGVLAFRLPAGRWRLRAVTRCNLHGLWESEKTIIIHDSSE